MGGPQSLIYIAYETWNNLKVLAIRLKGRSSEIVIDKMQCLNDGVTQNEVDRALIN